jgi:hypothetical protein
LYADVGLKEEFANANANGNANNVDSLFGELSVAFPQTDLTKEKCFLHQNHRPQVEVIIEFLVEMFILNNIPILSNASQSDLSGNHPNINKCQWSDLGKPHF